MEDTSIYNKYKYFLAVKTYDILMATYNYILFEIPMQDFLTLFEYIFQKGGKTKLQNINIMKNEHGISND